MPPLRQLVHLDADAFFASVEQAADPRLRGKPVAVGGEKRGIIAAASYEARRYGIYTPMPTARARRLCPQLILLPGDFEKYERFSRWMFSYAYDFTPHVEITSIDEGYLDLSGARQPSAAIARTLRRAIGQSLKISVSEGLGTSKLVSQIASKLNKPAAFIEIPPGHETDFLHPLPTRWLPGVGPQTASRLHAAGLTRIGQIAVTPPEMLQLLLGQGAILLRQFAQGIDDRPLIPVSAPAKSYSHQETFAQDQTNEPFLEATLRRMADNLMAKVRADRKSIRTLTVKVRYNDMDEDQCSESLSEPTDLESDLYSRLPLMLRHAWKRRVSLRLVSLRLSNVYEGLPRIELPWEPRGQQHQTRRRLAEVVDTLRHQGGHLTIMRGHDLVLREHVQPHKSTPAPGAKNNACPPPVKYRIPQPPPQTRTPQRQRKHTAVIPLAVHSYYSFLDSTLSIEAIVNLAQQQQLPAIALTDHHNLHGAVEFTRKAQAAGIHPILGAFLRIQNHPLWLYVQNAAGYQNLCRILSSTPGPEEDPPAKLADWLAQPPPTEGLLAVSSLLALAPLFPGRFYHAIRSPDEAKRHASASTSPTNLPAVALMPVHYATPSDRWKFNIVQSIRTLTLLEQNHPEKDLLGACHFRSAKEMNALFLNHPECLDHTVEIAHRCRFTLPFLPPQFPAFHPPNRTTPRTFLRHLVFQGFHRRYPKSLRAPAPHQTIRAQIEEELRIIHEVGYEEYFLVVWNILRQCRRRRIDWITRGSAADSLVCYCLGISDVCPVRFGLYFRRFLNKERMSMHKLPDIDIDFPHDRKDDVLNLVLQLYGSEHAAVVGGFSTFQARSAFAEIAKVLGVAEREVRKFTEHFPWRLPKSAPTHTNTASSKDDENDNALHETLRASPDCQDLPLDEEPYRTALVMAAFLDGFPRYPKMHPCGVVLSRQPMHTLTPTFISQKGYPTTHFDMDAVEAIGLVKIDILAQGGLAVMRDVLATLQNRGLHVDLRRFQKSKSKSKSKGRGRGMEEEMDSAQLSLVPAHAAHAPLTDDPAVWDMISSGGARAVHHIESPAMVGLCRMCHVSDIDGLIAIVSVIRPGAANELKKVQFARRYQKLEPSTYPHPSLEPFLQSTFGMVVYEEHILQICEAFAGLPLGRADTLRRALVKQDWKTILTLEREFKTAARQRRHPEPVIEKVWDLVEGFVGYAFCKAHSTAYGVEAYQSAWLKRYFPAEFMAAVLTHGKGFYHPLVYILECHRLGIPILPPCVNHPGPAFQTTPPPSSYPSSCSYSYSYSCSPPASAAEKHRAGGIRVPATRIKGLTDRTKERLIQEHVQNPFDSLRDFYRRVAPLPEEMEALLRAGALDSFGGTRTSLFWEVQHLCQTYGHRRDGQPAQGWLIPPPNFGPHPSDRPGSPLTEPSRRQRLEWEQELFEFPVTEHPLALHDHVAWETYCPVARLGEHIGQRVVACGLVIEQRIHHQATGEPMKFLSLADWTGMVETELFASTYRSYGLATVRYPVLEVSATVEPFENGRGFTLRIHRAGKPRLKNCKSESG